MNGYDNLTLSDRHASVSEAVSIRVSQMEKDPDFIERALNEIDCDLTDELMALRVNAHLTGNYEALHAYEAARVSQYLLKFAKAEADDSHNGWRASTADLFADIVRNAATNRFSGAED